MSTELVTVSSQPLVAPAQQVDAGTLEKVLVGGDLKALSPAERISYYKAVCESAGLNPLTRPFDYIVLNGKLTFYARKDCAEQLRQIHGVSIHKLDKEFIDGIFTVTAYARRADGRDDSDMGALDIGRLSGEAKCNAMMKCITKAKRRVTLSICGLGWLPDETEVESIPNAAKASVDLETGEITGPLPNTRAAQEAVAQRRIAELGGAQPPETEETEVVEAPVTPTTDAPKPDNWYAKMLGGFQEMKRELGAEVYYRILGNNGFEKSNQIPDRKTALRIYKEMGAELNNKRLGEHPGVVA